MVHGVLYNTVTNLETAGFHAVCWSYTDLENALKTGERVERAPDAEAVAVRTCERQLVVATSGAGCRNTGGCSCRRFDWREEATFGRRRISRRPACASWLALVERADDAHRAACKVIKVEQRHLVTAQAEVHPSATRSPSVRRRDYYCLISASTSCASNVRDSCHPR
jgi:hypothetical protein